MSRGDEGIDDVVEVTAVRARRAAGQRDFADQPPVAGGVAAARGAEHAVAHAHDFLLALVAVLILGGYGLFGLFRGGMRRSRSRETTRAR